MTKEEFIEEDIIEEIDPNEKPRVERVTKTVVKKRKRGLMERTVLAIMGPDGLPKVGRKVNQEIIVPMVKTMLVDSLTSVIQNMVWKNGGGPTNGQGNYYQSGSGNNYNAYNTNRTSYNQQYNMANNPEVVVPKISPNGEVPEFLISTRGEAAGVLDTLIRCIAQYGYCTVADYYDAIGVDGDFTANSFGWRDLRMAQIVPVQNGQFVIRFPRVVTIK